MLKKLLSKKKDDDEGNEELKNSNKLVLELDQRYKIVLG